MDRRQKLIMMRDILDHLHDCFEQWEAPQQRSVPWLAESIERDLSQFHRLCDSLRQDTMDTPPNSRRKPDGLARLNIANPAER